MNGSSMKIHHRSWLDSEIRRIRCVKIGICDPSLVFEGLSGRRDNDTPMEDSTVLPGLKTITRRSDTELVCCSD